MLSLLFAVAVSASPTTPCRLNLEKGETLIERRTLKVRDGTLEAVAVSKSDEKYGDPESRLVVLGLGCNVIFSQRFDDATKVLFSEKRLGEQPILFVTAFRPGGSGAGFDHALLAYGGEMFPQDGVQPLAPMSLKQGNMDGIFVGDLGRGRGPGLVTWNAQWLGQEAHYEPHQYEIVSYAWRNGRFVGPNIRTTKRKYNPEPNDVARRLGLGFKDMTQQSRFGWR
ncbi:MAG: hypothetical protein ABIQ32_04385 [Sphingomicrobium sp.]